MDKLVDESEEDFKEESINMQEHIYRMFRWARTHAGIESRPRIALLVSPAMTELVYEISDKNCYLMVAPYRPPKGLHMNNPTAIAKFIDGLAATKRMRYSAEDGLVER